MLILAVNVLAVNILAVNCSLRPPPLDSVKKCLYAQRAYIVSKSAALRAFLGYQYITSAAECATAGAALGYTDGVEDLPGTHARTHAQGHIVMSISGVWYVAIVIKYSLQINLIT